LAVVVGWFGVVPEPGLEPPFDGVLGVDGVFGVDGTVLPPPDPLPDPQPEPSMSLVGKLSGFEVVTYWPGLGKSTLKFSEVLHELMLARLATAMDGRLPMLPEPPEMETFAQFMYISRFPTLLNQVHARMALPDCTSCGTLKLRALTHSGALLPLHISALTRLPLAFVGQPPMNDWSTFQLAGSFNFAGSVSYVTEIWHDPPP
jgi:hypothetical protein